MLGIYDLVTHGVKPGMVPQFEHILQERQPSSLELEYPKPLGMWYSEYGPGSTGDSNDSLIVVDGWIFPPAVLSISPHKSFEEREKHRTAMMDDVEWKEMCMYVHIICTIRGVIA